MKKFLLSIFALMLAVFSVQAEEVTKSVTFSNYTAGTQYALNEKHDLGDGLVIYTTECHFTSELRIYSSSTHNGYVVSDALPGTITKMTFNAGNKVDKLDIYGSNDGTTWTSVGQVSVTSTSYKDYSFNFTGSYTRFKIDVNGSNQVRLKSMSVTYTTAGEGSGENPEPEEPETPVVTPPAAPTLPASCNFDNAMIVEITDIAEGATAYYSLNNDTEWTAGTSVTISETTTVFAKVVKDELSSEVVFATYTKNEPLPDGWIVDVLTHQWAGITGTNYSTWSNKTATSSAVYAGNSAGDKSSIQLRSNNSNSGIVTTQSGGKAKKIVVEWNNDTSDGRTLDVYGKNSAYSDATDLYDNLTQGEKLGSIVKGTSTELEITGDYEYIGLRSNSGAMYLTSISITWDTSDGVTVVPDAPEIPATSDFVTSMNFEITNFSAYEDGTTVYYSIDGGDDKEYTAPFAITTSCKIVAYAVNDGNESVKATATYTRIAKDPVINVLGDANADAFEGSIEVEIATENGATAYYTLNGEDPTIESTKYEEKLTIKATATLKVIAIEAGEYKSGIETQEFIMAISGNNSSEAESVTLSFASKDQRTEYTTSIQVWEQNGITLTNNKGKSTTNVGDYAGPARFYKNSEIIVEFTSPIAKIEFACNSSEYATDLKNSIQGSTVSGNTVTVQLDGSSNSFTIGNLSEGQVRMDSLTVTPMAEVSASSFNLTIGNAGWATLFLDYAVEIPEGVTCYTVAEVNSEKVTLASVTGVLPANTGVIVKANAGQYEFKPTDKVAEVAGLSGTTGNKYIFEDAYVLSIVNGEVGLYKAEMAGGVWLNNANRAYLPASAVPASAALSAGFRFDFDGTTGVEKVEIRNEKEEIYDLTGRRVNEITKAGVYIIGGRKILVK